jgi:hypothetical protein
MSLPCRITPQFSGRALPYDARRERRMKWRARAVAAPTGHGPLQLLVSRWHHAAFATLTANDAIQTPASTLADAQ